MLSLNFCRAQFVFAFTFLVNLVRATCYLPNGTAHDDQGTALCSSDPSDPLHNVCCHTRWTNPPGGDITNGSTADICLPNGLCENRGMSSIPGEEQVPWTRFYRVYCANVNWKGCIDVCRVGSNVGDVAQLTPCDGTPTSEKWCCGDTTDCCSPDSTVEAVFIPSLVNNASALVSSTSLVSTSSSVATSTSSGFTSAPPFQPAHENSKKNVTGITVGSVFGAVSVLSLGIFLVWRRRTKRVTGGGAIHELYTVPDQYFKYEAPKELVAEEMHEVSGEKLVRPEISLS